MSRPFTLKQENTSQSLQPVALFPSLRLIVDNVGEEVIFEGLELASDDWEEMEEYEYAFV